MATQATPQPVTPMFAPDGTIREIPYDSFTQALAAGGKLAVQMKAPDGTLRYVPHDMVPEAQKAGGVVNTEQGTPNNPEPKEGFWHSLGSVFGLTKEQLDARVANQQAHPFQSFLSDTGFGLGPAGNLIHSAATAGPEMAKKAYGESVAANTALAHKDFLSFLVHEIGGMGYTGAMVASPVLGESPAKAGEQIGSGNIKGGLGTATGIIAPIVAGGVVGKGKPAPQVEVPNVFDGEPPAEIPQGKPQAQPSDLAAKAKAISKVVGKEVTGKIPVLNRFDAFRSPTFQEYFNALRAKAQAASGPTEVPTYGNVSNAEARGPYQPYQGDLTVNPEAKTPVSRPAPTRGDSQVIQTFTESTPEEIAANNARIAANRASRVQPKPSDTVGTTSGAANDTALFQAARQKLGANASISEVAQEAQRMKDAGSNPNAPSTLPRQLSGEGVLNQALTSLDNQTLLKVAKSRGINVTREAQLKPGAANGTLVKKIIDDFSPDELDEARERGLEASLNKPLPADGVTPEAAAEAWRYKVLNTFFPDVAITKAMQTRVASTLAEQAKARFEAARAAALQHTPQVPSAAPASPASYMTSGSDLIEALRQMAAKSGK